MTDRIESLKEEIVELALVEGEKRIWEPLWELGAAGDAGSEAAELVERALRELNAEGRLMFFRRPWRVGEAGDRAEMDEAEVEAELSSSWWKELPLVRGDVWFAATAAKDGVQGRPRLPG